MMDKLLSKYMCHSYILQECLSYSKIQNVSTCKYFVNKQSENKNENVHKVPIQHFHNSINKKGIN
jgi:hypothetical protein